MKKVIYFFLFLFVTTAVFAQEDSNTTEVNTQEIKTQRANEAITNLKNGALIVRLTSNHKKLEALKKSAESENINESSRSRIKHLIKKTEEKTMKEAALLANVMDEKYEFSNYYLIWDYSTESLQNGVKEGYFLNKDLEIDPNIKLVEDKFLTLRLGRTSNMKLEAFRVTDRDLKELENPFPNYYRTNSFAYFINGLLASKTADLNQMTAIVISMNENFKNFYRQI